jgi:hypothetical protein
MVRWQSEWCCLFLTTLATCGMIKQKDGGDVMAYTNVNYRTKKSLVQDVKAGKRVTVYQPGPFGPGVKDGICYLEGPHYPEAHKWYASAIVKAGVIISIKS